jgi:hypothetical protein
MSEFRYTRPFDEDALAVPIDIEDLRAQLAAFNEERRHLFGGRPIDPEGMPELMPMEDYGHDDQYHGS